MLCQVSSFIERGVGLTVHDSPVIGPAYRFISRWRKKMCYMYTMEFYSAIRNKEMINCWKIDGPGDHV